MPSHTSSTESHACSSWSGGPLVFGGLPTPEVCVSNWWTVTFAATSAGNPSR
ncbi:hypothetical protein [Nonomuraea sp. B5E05]|uniref:hypothetical protein n=1 Tax=Nonomuraea sp. B5E05 TaxID=3153569 RepID=UPI003260C7F4